MTVRLRNVSFMYPAGESLALRDVSLEFAPGEVVLVTGRLGSGRSALLLVMAGLAPRVTGGRLDGVVERNGYCGLVRATPTTQLSGVAYSVRNEIAFGPANLGWPRDRIIAAVERELDRIDLRHLADRDPRTLSGGELQRVVLAGVLAMDPSVLLLDEPAAELDPVGAERVYALLQDLAKERVVVVASTDVDSTAPIADRAIVLEEGTVAADGRPSVVLGAERWVASRMSSTVAEIERLAGCRAPFSVTVDNAARRFA